MNAMKAKRKIGMGCNNQKQKKQKKQVRLKQEKNQKINLRNKVIDQHRLQIKQMVFYH
jgi:hypothetical protein